jgi:hypothetical protein
VTRFKLPKIHNGNQQLDPTNIPGLSSNPDNLKEQLGRIQQTTADMAGDKALADIQQQAAELAAQHHQ